MGWGPLPAYGTEPVSPDAAYTHAYMRHTLLATALVSLAACRTGAEVSVPPLVTGGPTPHTRGAADARTDLDPVLALARLEDILVGRWRGTGFGGELEETWNPVFGGRMLGTFRLVEDDALVFSEHIQLAEEDGRVVMRLVHLDPALRTWEERGDTTSFALVDVDGSTAWFGGLTIHRAGDRLTMHLAMGGEGGAREEVLTFERARFGS